MQPQMLFWIFLCYGYVLFTAANLLSDGSELLLFVPSIAGLVGSVVLPVLGAVPDGMMMLFSGLGDVEKAQESVAVGVGALAGSTIMLLTIPWFLGVVGGRVDIKDGKCQYQEQVKLTKTGLLSSLFGTGIRYKPEIKANAKIMVVTSMTYLLIQIPAYRVDSQNAGHADLKEIEGENKKEGDWALLGMIICLLEFFGYLYMQYAANLPEETSSKNSSAEILKEKFAGCVGWVKGKMEAIGLTPAVSRGYATGVLRAQELGIKVWMAEFRREWKLNDKKQEANKALLDRVVFPKEFGQTLAMWFKKYADPATARISMAGFDNLLRDLYLTGYSVEEIFKQVDQNSDGDIDADEFQECWKYVASLPPQGEDKKGRRSTVAAPVAKIEEQFAKLEDEMEEEEEEEEDMPEEWKDLDENEQRRQILMRSCYKMGLGTLLVLIFSDPMVDVLGEIGVQSGIPAFYISFVLAPLASNSSELVAAFNYAQKKTSKTITISLNTLEGAACMNNTFCLGIFMGLIYFQGLAWKFTAETISILVVQLIMAVIVLMEDTQRLILACGILMLFPGALALVYWMENFLHLD